MGDSRFSTKPTSARGHHRRVRMVRLFLHGWSVEQTAHAMRVSVAFVEDVLRVYVREKVALTKSLWFAGQPLATAAFNLKQRTDLPQRDRSALGEAQEAWDRAVRG